jgi:hypothetical protein
MIKALQASLLKPRHDRAAEVLTVLALAMMIAATLHAVYDRDWQWAAIAVSSLASCILQARNAWRGYRRGFRGKA